MTDEEREQALADEAVEYADQKSRAGFWSREESLAKAREEIQGFVGPDPAARGHAFYFGVDGDGPRVGWVWYGPVPDESASKDERWLFQIKVEESLRGRGFGRGLLEALERHLVGERVSALRLNVFRWNVVAMGLYRSAGYEVISEGERNLEMRKSLARG